MLHNYSGITVVVFGVFFLGTAGAAGMGGATRIGPSAEGGFEAKTINAGAFEVMPWLGLSVGRDSNVGLSNGAQSSTNFTLLNPNLIVGLSTKGQYYGASYSGNFRRYTASSIDNYNDHNLGVVADNVWSARLNTLVNADYIRSHDGRNALLFRNKELYHTTGIKARGHYGAEGAQGQFELAAGQLAKRYDSNNSGATQLYNYDRTDLSGAFFYKVAPLTQLFVEVSDSKFAYVDVASKRLDSNEQHYMMGAKWEATAKTTGIVKFGTMKKSFNLGTLPSGSSAVWDAQVEWKPKTYSKVDASLHQAANEYGGTGSFILSRDADFKWTHNWSSYVTSALTFGDGADTFQASARSDKRQTYGLRVVYGFRSWLRAGVEYQHTKRTSTDALSNYTKAVTMLTLEGSL